MVSIIKKAACLFLITLSFPLIVMSDQITNSYDVTEVIPYPRLAFAPVMARNTKDKESVVVWLQEDEHGTFLYGRILHDDGTMGALKKFQTKVKATDAYSTQVAYNPDDNTYLVIYQSDLALRSQLYSPTLVKKGSSHVITNAILPYGLFRSKLRYSTSDKAFYVYGQAADYRTPACQSFPNDCHDKIMVLTLDKSGKFKAPPVDLLTLPVDFNVRDFNVFTDPTTQNSWLQLNTTEGVSAFLWHYVATPDGKLLKNSPTKINVGKNTILDSTVAFDQNGAGIVGWCSLYRSSKDGPAIGQALKFKRIQPNQIRFSSTKKVPHDPGQPNAGIGIRATLAVGVVFDPINNDYVFVWHELGTLKAVRVDAATGALRDQPFTLATIRQSPNSPNLGIDYLSVRYDSSSGRIFVAWLEADTTYFFSQVRAVSFEK